MRQACRSINAARRDWARSRLSGWGRYRHVETSNQVRAAVRSGGRVEVRLEPPDVIGEELVDGAEGESPGPAGLKTREQGREFRGGGSYRPRTVEEDGGGQLGRIRWRSKGWS